MSILFLPPQSAGSVTIPDATETTSGKIRIATSAEATAGTNDVTAMTPAKVKSVVDASLVGGVTYQGTLDASAPADLSNATKGDLYIISVAGTYAGKTWAVGDHLLVNADMGGTLDSAKIDKVDNTDAVTSVAGRTGAITLSTADVSGLATVASTGAYSDLSGTPTLGTAAAEDVGTSAGNVVQLDGSAKLPALDGSQLTNLPAPTIELNDLTDVTFTAGAGIDNYVLTYNNGTGLWGAEAVPSAPKSFYSFGTINVTYTAPAISDNRCQYYNLATGGITLTIPSASSSNAIGGLVVVRNTSTSAVSVICPSANLADGTTATTFDLEPEEARSFVWFSTTVLHEISASSLGQLTNVDLSGLANGDVLIYNSTSGKWEAGSTPATSVALDDLTDVTITAAATGEVLRYNGSAWVDAQLAYSDLSGTPTLATVATTGAYSDLSGTPTNVSTFTNDAGYISDITAENLGDLADVDLTGLADGEIIIYNATSGKWEANPPPAPQATTTSVGLIEIAENAEATAGTATDKALVPSNISSITTAQLDNSAGTMLESANNLSDLANAATARTNLGLGSASVEDVGTSAGNVVQLDGSAKLPAVDGSQLTNLPAPTIALNDLTDVTITAASTGEVLRYNGSAWVDAQLAYSDLSGTPTLGTAAVEDVGTSAGNVVQLDGSAKLPAVDGSALTGVKPSLPVVETYTSSQTLSAPTAHNTLIVRANSASALTITLPSSSSDLIGFRYEIKQVGAGALTIAAASGQTIDGASSHLVDSQNDSRSVIAISATAWEIF